MLPPKLQAARENELALRWLIDRGHRAAGGKG